MNNSVKSAARVLDILELLFRSEEPMALKDLVAILALPKSSAHALMQTLQSRGYVERDAADRYMLNEFLRQSPGWIGGPAAHLAAAGPAGVGRVSGPAGDGAAARRAGRNRVPGRPRRARRRQGHRQVGQPRADPLRFRQSRPAPGLLHWDGQGAARLLGQEVERCLFDAHSAACLHAQ